MSRRKSTWLDEMAAKIAASICDPALSPERMASATGLVKSSLELSYRQGFDEGIQRAQRVLAGK